MSDNVNVNYSEYLPHEGSKRGCGSVYYVTTENGWYGGGCTAVIHRSKQNAPLDDWQNDIVWGKGETGPELRRGMQNDNYQRVYTRHFCQHETITIPELGATPFCSHHLGLLYARGCNSSSVKSYIDNLEEGILYRREVMEAVRSVLERSKEELWRQLQIAELIYESTTYREVDDYCWAISEYTGIRSVFYYINAEFAIIDMAIRRIGKRLARYQT